MNNDTEGPLGDESYASGSLPEPGFRALELLDYPDAPRPMLNLEDLTDDAVTLLLQKVNLFQADRVSVLSG
jgi:hypothetical protein